MGDPRCGGLHDSCVTPAVKTSRLGNASGSSRGFVITSPALAAGVVHTIIVSAKPYIYMTEKK